MRRSLNALILLALMPIAAGAEELAIVGKQAISRAEVEEAVEDQLDELEAQRYEILRGGIDHLVARSLIEQEAASRGTTAEALQKTEIIDKAGEPTEAEIQKLYDDNRAQMEGQTLDQVKGQIVQYLKQGRMQTRAQALIAELKKKYPTKIMLRPKTVEVGVGSRPLRGGDTAPVTIVEFSDYECGFCKRSEPTVKKVLELYGDKVRLAYRDFPLPLHANARPASEAAHCAADQGEFWKYHDELMAASDLSVDTFKTIAKKTGLDEKKFEDCLAAERFDTKIDEDMAAGEAAGVTGTPAFFINGRMLEGAQPLEKFQEVIDEELELAEAAS
jgi:protein-disulfide isomerase